MNSTLPRGLCRHCSCLVYPGGNCLVRPGGEWMHRRCWSLAVQADREETLARRDRRVILAVFVVVGVFLVALLAVSP